MPVWQKFWEYLPRPIQLIMTVVVALIAATYFYAQKENVLIEFQRNTREDLAFALDKIARLEERIDNLADKYWTRQDALSLYFLQRIQICSLAETKEDRSTCERWPSPFEVREPSGGR